MRCCVTTYICSVRLTVMSGGSPAEARTLPHSEGQSSRGHTSLFCARRQATCEILLLWRCTAMTCISSCVLCCVADAYPDLHRDSCRRMYHTPYNTVWLFMLHHIITVDLVPRFRSYIPQLRAELHRCALRLALRVGPTLLRLGKLAWGGYKGGAGAVLQETHAGNGGEASWEIVSST